MGAISTQAAYDQIKAHIKKQGGGYRKWYCGITSDIDDRLFGDHKVPKNKHWYAWKECQSADDARIVEEALLKLGCDGGGGGGDDTSVYVYAYLKSNVTDP